MFKLKYTNFLLVGFKTKKKTFRPLTKRSITFINQLMLNR